MTYYLDLTINLNVVNHFPGFLQFLIIVCKMYNIKNIMLIYTTYFEIVIELHLRYSKM